jgi:hypothetical protein
MVNSVMAHRVILRPEARLRKLTAAAVLNEVVSDVRVPAPAHGDEGDDVFGRGR